ncbi:MAG: hypothetical protein QOD71_2541 [Thermoleophilaceae bacterium]|jgi:uncharacterized membrane protein|nr:hypothetical protein [Thermoleophilaceae bacterium]
MSTQPNGAGALAPEQKLARFLGVFSLSLGAPQIAAPGRVNRLIGVRDDRGSRRWQRIVGIREIAAGAGILSKERPVEWVWSRVAGDMKDLALLGSAMLGKAEDRKRLAAATGAVVGITVADILDAVALSRAPGRATPNGVRVKAAITVRRPREDVYRFWHTFENLPQFMDHLESVEPRGERGSFWRAKAPAGMKVEWEAELVDDRPGELISWRSRSGATVRSTGTVRFSDAPRDRGTEVRVDMEYQAPGGLLAATVAKLFGEEPEQQITDDLRRLKQVMETGMVVRSEGSPEGTSTRRLLRQRSAQPLTGDNGKRVPTLEGRTS